MGCLKINLTGGRNPSCHGYRTATHRLDITSFRIEAGQFNIICFDNQNRSSRSVRLKRVKRCFQDAVRLKPVTDTCARRQDGLSADEIDIRIKPGDLQNRTAGCQIDVGVVPGIQVIDQNICAGIQDD